MVFYGCWHLLCTGESKCLFEKNNWNYTEMFCSEMFSHCLLQHNTSPLFYIKNSVSIEGIEVIPTNRERNSWSCPANNLCPWLPANWGLVWLPIETRKEMTIGSSLCAPTLPQGLPLWVLREFFKSFVSWTHIKFAIQTKSSTKHVQVSR